MHSETKSEKLQSLLYLDDLTQIFNRRYLSEQVPQKLLQANKKDQTIAFFMIDMDKFKSINDTYGHQAGDDALVHFFQNSQRKDPSRRNCYPLCGG